MAKVPYFTTAASSAAVARAIGALREHHLEVRSLQDYYSLSRA
jgi:carbamoyl-phosphate synthase large subunit